MRKALATAERRIEELNERARIADAERGVAVARANAETAQLREQLAVHLESLHTAKERLGVQRADIPELEDQLFARADRIAALEKSSAADGAALADKIARLAKSEQRCEVLDCDDMNLRATVARRNAQIATLEADLAARQQRESQTQRAPGRCAGLHRSVRAAAARRARMRATNRFACSRWTWKSRDPTRPKRTTICRSPKRAFATSKSTCATRTGKLEEANVTVEEWRAVIAESQRSILQRDGQIQQLAVGPRKAHRRGPDSAAQTGEEIALEGPARVLIRTDGNTDFVHVLGRRTRIGRGSDNELVLDTKHISRYHAVLLAGPVHTSIEDLNSTNGVFVNGKRVSRQVAQGRRPRHRRAHAVPLHSSDETDAGC